MSITQTSLKSKNYNALGIYEIADDISNIITVVNAMPESLTTATVNISSAQILAMGTTPIELLPAPGVGMYYDIEKVILEYTYGTTAYTLADLYLGFPNSFLTPIYSSQLTGLSDCVNIVTQGAKWSEAADFIAYSTELGLNNWSVQFTTWAFTNPTLGDGTMRAIITYTVRTFGA